MRWSIRRGEKGPGAHDAPAPPPPVLSAEDQEAVPASPPARPAWTSLPPLTQSWSAQAPLTTVVQPVTRSITHRPAAATADGRPEPGRVIGLASVVAPVAAVAETQDDVARGSYYAAEAPLRHAPARPLVEHAPLTEAVDAYVGEPVAPTPVAPPPPAPTIFPSQAPPRSTPKREAATDAGAAFQEALANLASSGHAPYVPGGGTERPQPSTASAPVPAPERPSGLQPPTNRPLQLDPERGRGLGAPPLTHRRNSLAESRRLGLGAPLQEVPRPGEPPEAREPPVAAPTPTTAPQASEPAAPTGPAATPTPASESPPAAAEPAVPMTPTDQHRRADDADDTTGRRGASDDRSGPDDDGPGGSRPLAPVTPVRPITDPSVRPTLRTTPLVYRATPRPQLSPAEPRVIERAVVTRAPQDLVQSLRASHGIDVRDVEVRRDTAVNAEASQRGARAFTRGATVHLPESAGPVDSTSTRALLAHELVHAAQQRRLGGALPAEHTHEGRALEAEALAAERSYGGNSELTSQKHLRHAPPPVSAAWVDDRITQHAIPQPSFDSPFDDNQKYEIEWIAQETAKRTIGELGGDSGGEGTSSAGSSSVSRASSAARVSGSGTAASVPRTADAPLDESQLPGMMATNANDVGIGPGHATNLAEFIDQMIEPLNVYRQSQGQLPLSATSLSTADHDMFKRRWDDAVAAKHRTLQARADLARQVAPAVGAIAAATATSWTREGGFGSGGTPAAGPAAVPAAVPGQAGAPADPAATAAAASASGLRAAAGRGAGPAPSLSDIRERALSAINVERENQGLARQDVLTPHQLQFTQELFENATKARTQAEARTAALAQHVASPAAAVAGAVVAAHATPVAGGSSPTAATGTAAPHGSAGTVPAGSQTAATSAHSTTPLPSSTQGNINLDHMDIEDLTSRIYDRLRTRLRTELLVDRERAGLLTDFR